MKGLEEIFIENPVIAAIRNDEDLENVCESKAKIVFVLYGNILNLKSICNKLKENRKFVFVHIDMMEGIRGDFLGIQFIKKEASPFGIITTKPSNIKYAKQLGLCSIQRIFIIDSFSLKSGIKNVKEQMPDAIEVMPGIASKIIASIEDKVNIPVIAGGLISTKKDVVECLSMGAMAVSTSNLELWNL
ncbi:glycerol uptake operon antiterminator regulatory protein [Fervidicella metallireducens AeB]|uniref:Glycerol uptake operon antiterminator regulatory protein n=1 Tax=Fervidicella metallireducens AeB TaxID=1403537 RepID=A0A017RVN7_9CLOT|nr:glycerol-3-phosphate responsive antiterminator [Fervidicella metallireducens]EYE88747.1 glycerol uptake operon antiterminator regulatory protein [Fervidicella metallireducens AeB]